MMSIFNRFIDRSNVEERYDIKDSLLAYVVAYLVMHDWMISNDSSSIVFIVLFLLGCGLPLGIFTPITYWRKSQVPRYAKIVYACFCEIILFFTLYGIFFIGNPMCDYIMKIIFASLVPIWALVFMVINKAFTKPYSTMRYTEFFDLGLVLLAVEWCSFY